MGRGRRMTNDERLPGLIVGERRADVGGTTDDGRRQEGLPRGRRRRRGGGGGARREVDAVGRGEAEPAEVGARRHLHHVVHRHRKMWAAGVILPIHSTPLVHLLLRRRRRWLVLLRLCWWRPAAREGNLSLRWARRRSRNENPIGRGSQGA